MTFKITIVGLIALRLLTLCGRDNVFDALAYRPISNYTKSQSSSSVVLADDIDIGGIFLCESTKRDLELA